MSDEIKVNESEERSLREGAEPTPEEKEFPAEAGEAAGSPADAESAESQNFAGASLESTSAENEEKSTPGEKKDPSAGEPQARKITDKKAKRRARKAKRPYLKWIILVLVLVVAAAVLLRMRTAKNAAAEVEVDTKNIGMVTRGDIQNALTSSGSLSAKDTYTITSLVEGEIIEADFEEGDQVEKGQVLYRIDPSDMDREIETAQKNVQYAEDDLEEAKEDLAKAQSDLNGGTWCAKSSGYIKNLNLKAGDSVSQNLEIADLYNDTTMKLKLPFLSIEADAIAVGTQMIVTLSDTGEQIPGQVIEKSSMEEALTGGTVVKYVTLVVSNPGGLSASDSATAQSGDISSVASGTFEAYTENKLKYDLSASVKVASVLVHDGQYVTAGTPVFTMTQDSLSDALKSYEKAIEQAEQSLDNAQNSLEQQAEKLEDYTITAPISGQVIRKSGKVGDKISKSGSDSDNTLAIIYDLSELTFEMSIDELDISNVEVGQEVDVTADAFEDETYTGHVTNVSLNGSYQSGVTTYPVTVTLDDEKNLLPSMNVDGTIILEEATDVLRIPANALQRGNIVYVRDTSLTEEQKAAAEGGAGGEAGAPGTSGAGDAPAEDAGIPAGSAEETVSVEIGGTGSASVKSPAPGVNVAGDAGNGGGEVAVSVSGGSGGAVTVPAGGAGGASMPKRNDAPAGFTPVRVEVGLISDDYVEVVSGLSEGQEVYVKESTQGGGMFMMMGGFGGGPGGGPGGGSRR